MNRKLLIGCGAASVVGFVFIVLLLLLVVAALIDSSGGNNISGRDGAADDLAAEDPARETVEVHETQSNSGFSVTLKRVEFGEETTRAYVEATNGTQSWVRMFGNEAHIMQDSRQILAKMDSKYMAAEPASDIEPGTHTDGVITLGPADPSAPFELRIQWYSGDGNINNKPLVFQVTP